MKYQNNSIKNITLDVSLSKIIFIGDPHLDSKTELLDLKIKILDDIFKNECEHFVILGDLFDKSHGPSSLSSDLLKTIMNKHQNKTFYIIIGNHDIYVKNKISPNSIETALSNIQNVKIINKPYELNDFLLVPWICKENQEEVLNSIETTNKRYIAGHFEINGFIMSGNMKCLNGLSKKLFSKFDKVVSGHFHIRNEYENILYCGSLVQETWNDFNNRKGYYIFDNGKYCFNPIYKEFYKHLIIDDENSDFEIDDYKDCHVKIFHKKQLTKKQFEKIELLKNDLKSYIVFDESIVLIENEIDQQDFDKLVDQFFENQDIDLKDDIIKYLKLKNKEIE